MRIDCMAKKLVELRGLKSQNEVSSQIGISTSALSMYENGNRVPRDEIKIKIAKYYKTPVDEIFFKH